MAKETDALIHLSSRYYAQAQCGMAVLDIDCYHWMSRHNQMPDKMKNLYIKVERYDDYIDLLNKRSGAVIEKANLIVEQLLMKYS